jgi:glycine/D-amino acid oxidase-like deaminating enzyme
VETWRSAGVRAEWLTVEEIQRLVPITAGGSFVGGAYGLDDGVADIAALLEAFLRAARASGATVRSGCRLVSVETSRGAVTGVRTSQEHIATPVLVNAAGAWAVEVGRLAGASPLPIRSYKRHLMVTSPLPFVDRSWPSVWDWSEDVYFRPEPPGLLLSPCDATESAPHAETTEPSALELLAEKLARALPRLAGVAIATTWAGLRTFAADGNLLLGGDPSLKGFFWCAGLGGNGMTLSPALGRIVADAVLGQAPPSAYAATRFAAA